MLCSLVRRCSVELLTRGMMKRWMDEAGEGEGAEFSGCEYMYVSCERDGLLRT
jgi:hypothetical protein